MFRERFRHDRVKGFYMVQAVGCACIKYSSTPKVHRLWRSHRRHGWGHRRYGDDDSGRDEHDDGCNDEPNGGQ